MPNEIHQKPQTAIVVADATDYAGDLGTRTDQIDLTSLAAGAARQSDKVDLAIAAPNLAELYAVYAAVEFAVAPTAGEVVDFYAGFSPSATPGTANPGGLSGADGAYSGTAGSSLDEAVRQLVFIGSLVATPDATTVVQFQFLGFVVAPERYVAFVADNNADQALVGDAVEMGIRVVPYTPEVQ